MIILLHSSKTMRSAPTSQQKTTTPAYSEDAAELANYIQTLSPNKLAQVMHISPALAKKTHQTFTEWSLKPEEQTAAIDCFLGDIYSGFQTPTLTDKDRNYAQDHLRILSGMYGILRPLDGVMPYRLEMAYKLPKKSYQNLYDFWGNRLAQTIPDKEIIINVSSAEYAKAILSHLKDSTVITPRFLTVDSRTKEPKFVVVHAKIARGAFASWVIKERIENSKQLEDFTDLGYKYDPDQSTPEEPVYVASEFGGLGLSVRLTKS